MSPLPRTLEPESMAAAEEVREYLEMDHAAVNATFVDDLFAGGPVGGRILDLGCGTAQIPILICKRSPDCEVMAVDSSIEMLEAARIEVELEGVVGQIALVHDDCKSMDAFESETVKTLISNSLLHHLPEPVAGLSQMVRLVESGGRLFVRDLVRPTSASAVEELVGQYAGAESDFAQQLLRQSLHAALTLDEIRGIARSAGVDSDSVAMTSDRHWTLDWVKS